MYRLCTNSPRLKFKYSPNKWTKVSFAGSVKTVSYATNKFSVLILTSSPHLHFPQSWKFLQSSVRNLCTYGVDGVNSLSSVRLSRPLFVSAEAKAPLLCEAFCCCSFYCSIERVRDASAVFSIVCFFGGFSFSFGKKNGVALTLNLPICAVFYWTATG